MRIIIGGHGGCCGDPLGLFGGHFHGFFRMEIDDEMLDELFAPGFPFDDDIGDLERELHEEIFGRPPPPHHDPGYPQWHGDPTERVDTPAPPPAQYQLLRGEAPSDGADVVEL
jgi:hypothetical protein